MLALISLLSFAADDDDLMGPKPPPYDKHVSITISPIHLIFPMVELTAEGRATDRLGVAGVLGVGSVSRFPALEAGVQGRYYPVGSFDHGMQLGAEALIIYLLGADVNATGFSVGPFIGYKIAARFGLTFEAQLGAQFIAARATAGTASTSDSQFGPLLNLNVGWSF